jgi:Ca-activated chloride channel homolog
MRRNLLVIAVLVAFGCQAHAAGMLIPVEKKLPPLAMLDHKVQITIEDQVATTTIEQTFRNNTSRQLEATYLLPVPKGANVKEFFMWVGGNKVKGELVEADKARKIYTDIVSRTKDPGLLEYVGTNLLRMKVFPVPANGDQKVAVTYSYLANNDGGLVEYIYPLRTDGKAATTLDKFSISVKLKSQHPITNIYSPSHAITVSRPNDKEATIGFEKDQAVLDKDFQLFYTPGNKDVGLTALTHRPNGDQNGYFMLLVSPRAELSKKQQAPRDMIFVLDTSGSMRGKRMTQARNALIYCLNNLTPTDNFAILNFATTVNKYTETLQVASAENVAAARKWVEALEATGGTAIDDALKSAMGMRAEDKGRTFTIVFFTDGRPTIGETRPEKILQNVAKQNTQNTRIFSFGVGDDVNAQLLDTLSDSTRAISTYVRESEDIEAKVSGLYGKISNPVLTNLKLSISDGVTLNEVYPPQLPDLFHGSQLVVLGRYTGKGHAAITLDGMVGMESKQFVYELNFADKTSEDKAFVEDLWARRKVGYLLDQIRVNGEKKELVDEIVALAKRHGITTPYTSYLLVPDAPPKVAGKPGGQYSNFSINTAPPAALQRGFGGGMMGIGGGLGGGQFGQGGGVGGPTMKLAEFAKGLGTGDGKNKKDIGETRQIITESTLAAGAKDAKGGDEKAAYSYQLGQLKALDKARGLFNSQMHKEVQGGKLGVDFAVQNNALRFQNRLTATANRFVQQRNLIDVGGVWIDEKFDPKLPSVVVKAQSAAYFRILERQPKMREVLSLGNFIVWVSPSGTALIIDLNDGQETMTDDAIDRLFVAKK